MLTPEQQMWINNGAQIGPDGVPFIEPGGYYMINGVGHVNTTGQNIPLFGPQPAGTDFAQIPDPLENLLRQQGGGFTQGQYFNSPDPNQRFNPGPQPPATGPQPPATAPQPPAPTQSAFPPSLSWLNTLMTMMPPRPAPPRPISNIFDPSSFAPSTSAFPGGTSAFTPQSFDPSGMEVKADNDLNSITKQAMASNENLGRQGALQYGGTMRAPDQSVMFPPIARESFAPFASTNLSYPWIMTDMSRNSPASRTGK